MDILLTGRVFWCYDYEVSARDTSNDFAVHFGVPFHTHEGEITLTDEALVIEGDEDLRISLGQITQVALGFDESFPSTLVKNFGLFWQPLRLSLRSNENIYLIIDYNLLLGPKNHRWFIALKELLSD